MDATPRLSIGLPVYNGEKYLAESLDALLGQSYEDFELLISDNASTDDTASICDQYQRQDSRIRYFRHACNIGSSPNHDFVFQQSRGELFKWAAADDLYAQDLLARCIAALDEHPSVVLAHSWTAAIDDLGNVTQALEYPLTTDSPSAPERFRSMLFGTGERDVGVIRADDQYGVIRADVIRRVGPQGSYYHSDRTIMTKLALYGPFHQQRAWLYFRRDHGDRPQYARPTVRGWCVNQDPRRANKWRHPTARLLAEYFWGYVSAIQGAPLVAADKRACYGYLARWAGGRAAPVTGRILRRHVVENGSPVGIAPPEMVLDEIVAGREKMTRGQG
jgi:glycosyltransferase involved in cell wall biosynthesis